MISFRVHGVPAPQGSKTAFVRSGKAVVVEGASATGRQKVKSWRAEVVQAAHDAMIEAGLEPLEGPISIVLTFVMPRPKSAPKWKSWCDKRPDVDKLQRSTFDAMTGVVYKDDGQICALSVGKRYVEAGEPAGAYVSVQVLDEPDKPQRKSAQATGR